MSKPNAKYLSASRIKLAKDCEYGYMLKYNPPSAAANAIKKRANNQNDTQAAINGTNLHKALEDWINEESLSLPRLMELYDKANTESPVDFHFTEDGKKMLRRWFNARGMSRPVVIGCEVAMGSNESPYLLDNGTPIFGFIDLILEEPDGTIHLVDYKSVRAPMTQEEADNNLQAGIYFAWASENYPGRPLKFSFDLLRYGTVEVEWPLERINAFKGWLQMRYQYINALDFNTEDYNDPTYVKAQLGDGCKWCPFTDLCPEATKIMKEGAWQHIIQPGIPEDESEAIAEFQRIKAVSSLLQNKKKKIETWLKEEVFGDQQPEDCVLETDDWVVRWTESERKSYNMNELVDILSPHAVAAISKASNSAVDRIIPVLPEHQAQQVKAAATFKPSRTLRVSRRK